MDIEKMSYTDLCSLETECHRQNKLSQYFCEVYCRMGDRTSLSEKTNHENDIRRNDAIISGVQDMRSEIEDCAYKYFSAKEQ